MTWRNAMAAAFALVTMATGLAQQSTSSARGVEIGGELRQWHKVTLTLDGPQADERASDPESVSRLPDDGDVRARVRRAELQRARLLRRRRQRRDTSATAGNKWRAHLRRTRPADGTGASRSCPARTRAIDAAVAADAQPVAPFDGLLGSVQMWPLPTRVAPDFRARGPLQYVGGHYLRFAGTGEYFLKVGADSPETLLAYADFDGTVARKPAVPLNTYAPHVADWKPAIRPGRTARARADRRAQLPLVQGRQRDVVPHLQRRRRRRQRLAVRRPGTTSSTTTSRSSTSGRSSSITRSARASTSTSSCRRPRTTTTIAATTADGRPPGGLDTSGASAPVRPVAESLDGGDLGAERKLYLRELIARFGYELALNWNLGEENTQTPGAAARDGRLHPDTDPYTHHIVVHTYPHEQEQVYPRIARRQSA